MKKILTLALVAIISIFSFKATAQGVAVNTTSAKADTSAMLDVSSTTKGLLAPRMTKTQRDAIVTPATGLLVYQTDNTPSFYYYDGTQWTTLKGATGAIGVQGVQGNTGSTGASGQDVPTGGSTGQVLTKINGTDYNTQWTTPSVGGGGMTFSLPLVNIFGSNNSGGNGTYFPYSTGVNTTESLVHKPLPFACTKATLQVMADGSLSSPYTFSLRMGTPNGSGLTFTDIPNSSITVSGTTMQTINLAGLNIPAGNTVAVRVIGTAAFNSAGQQKNLLLSCTFSE